MRIRHLFLLLCLALALSGCRSETPAEHAANTAAQQELDAAPPNGNLPHYSLPPQKLAKAQHIAAVSTRMFFVGTVWTVLQYVLLLWLGWAAWMRDCAVKGSRELRAKGKDVRAFWREGILFMLLLRLYLSLSRLPLSAYGHHLSVKYGFSVQSWGSWFADWAKGFGVTAGCGILIGVLLILRLRRSPRWWWLQFWAVIVPISLVVVFLVPVIYDPLFNKFEPLQASHPELVQQMESVVAKGHMDIPPERMFLMKASDKVTTLNAYVTGFGASKRVVVWDTSLAKATPDEILFIFGHESGHYVLGHILRGVVSSLLGLFVLLYALSRLLPWLVRRFGGRWKIGSPGDWAAIAVLMFVVTLVEIASEPVVNAVSRSMEHEADVYGQEAVHGIVNDPQLAAQQAFQVLGENSLDVPNTLRWEELWRESHPIIGRRAAFAARYDPWREDAQPKYFNK